MTERMAQVNAVNTILCAAEAEIRQITGLDMRVIVVSRVPDLKSLISPEAMLSVIANALEMQYSDYQVQTRKREYLHLRQLGCYFLKQYFGDKLTLTQIGDKAGCYDHTMALHSIQTVDNKIRAKDCVYYKKYEFALEAVTQWMSDEK